MNQTKDNSIRSYPQWLFGAKLQETRRLNCEMHRFICSRAILSRVPLAGSCRQGEAGANVPARPGRADHPLVMEPLKSMAGSAFPVPCAFCVSRAASANSGFPARDTSLISRTGLSLLNLPVFRQQSGGADEFQRAAVILSGFLEFAAH